MAAFTKFQKYVEDVHHGVHNHNTCQHTVALTNTLPVAATAGVIADITEVSYTYCSTRSVTKTSSGQTGGTYKLVLQDLTLTASGGAVGPFQYVVLYNSTAANGPLIGFYNYGSAVTLADGETLDIDFDATNGVFDDV